MTPVSTNSATSLVEPDIEAPPNPLIFALEHLPNAAFSAFIKLSVKKSYKNINQLSNHSLAMRLLLNYADSQQEPILHDAVRQKKMSSKEVDDLLSAGSDLNALNGKGQTALDVAVEVDSVEMAQFLMRNGAIVSNTAQFEEWISKKPSLEVAGFLHAGFQPTTAPPLGLDYPIRVLWIHSRIDWLTAIYKELESLKENPDRLKPFLQELAYQRREEPLFQLMISLLHTPYVILFAWGVVPFCPVLNEAGLKYLTVCIEAGIMTDEKQIQPFPDSKTIEFYERALEALPKIAPTGRVAPFYKRYVLKIKYGLFGTLFKPSEVLLVLMAEKLPWHPNEWGFIQREYETSISPKTFSDDVDPGLKYFLRGFKNLEQDKEKARKYFRMARRRQVPIAYIEEGRLLIGKNEKKKGLNLMIVALSQEVYRAYRWLALTPDISFKTLSKRTSLNSIIQPLSKAGDPAASIAIARNFLAFNSLIDSAVWNHIEILWDTPFKGDAFAALRECHEIIPYQQKDLVFLERLEKEKVVPAIGSLAKNSVESAKRLVKLAKRNNRLAVKLVMELLSSVNCWTSDEVMQYLSQNVSLNWVLRKEKINLETIFRTEKAPDLSHICKWIATWDQKAREFQVSSLQQEFPEDALKEIFENRARALSFDNLKYLKELNILLPLISEVSPSLRHFIRAYKVALYRDTDQSFVIEPFGWMPCSEEDLIVLGSLFRHNFMKTEIQDLLPGQKEYIEAFHALQKGQSTEAKELYSSSFDLGFNPGGKALVGVLLKQQDYQRAFTVARKLLDAGNHGSYPHFVNFCIELVGKRGITPQEAADEISLLVYKPNTAVYPGNLRYFLKGLHSTSHATEDFFDIALITKFSCTKETWKWFLDMVYADPAILPILKIQLHLLGNLKVDNIFQLPNLINSKRWLKFLNKDNPQLKQLIANYLLDPKNI